MNLVCHHWNLLRLNHFSSMYTSANVIKIITFDRVNNVACTGFHSIRRDEHLLLW